MVLVFLGWQTFWHLIELFFKNIHVMTSVEWMLQERFGHDPRDDLSGMDVARKGSRCEVGIQELPKDSPLGRLRGSDNVWA
nr:hypothetical protein CFP56_48944 [Quercus suber]